MARTRMEWERFDRASRPECRRCPRFKDGVFVPPEICVGGPLVLAEAPGQQEIAPAYQSDRRPLVGDSGKVLDSMLGKAGLQRSGCSIANVVQCGLPGSNEDPTPDAIECCAGVLNEVVERARPTVIVALGKYALQRLTGKTRITDWMGSVLATVPEVVVGSAKRCIEGVVYKSGKKKGQPKPVKVDVTVTNPATDTPVIPTLHPSAVIRSQFVTVPLAIAHLRRAQRLHKGSGLVEVAGKARGGWADLSVLEGLLRRPELVVDIEAAPDGAITMVGVGWSKDEAVTFHPSKRLFEALARWCADPSHTFIAHNAVYDMSKLEEVGVEVRCRVWDTMHAAQYERPDLRQSTTSEGAQWNKLAGLDAVASRMPELDYFNWKAAFREGLAPDENVYCQRDCCVEWYLYERLRARLEKRGQLAHFENVMMPLLKVLYAMQRRGVRIDVAKAESWLRTQRSTIARLERTWDSLVPVRPSQTVALMSYFYDELGLKEQHVGRGKTRRRTLDKAALEKLHALYPDRTELATLVALRHTSKVAETYLTRMLEGVDSNGYYHFEYNLTGTSTGRLSSDAQQFPRPHSLGHCHRGVEGCHCGRLRELIVGDPGQRVITADYSQIEAIITAILAGEHWLVEGFASPDFDFHQQTGDMLAEYIGGEFAEMSPAERRKWGKMANHASNYVQTWKGIQKSFGCSAAIAKQIERAIRDMRPATVTWWSEVEQFVGAHGFVRNPWGRRAYIPPKRDWRGQWGVELSKAVAFIPQSSAFEVIAGAMLRAHEAGLRLMIQAHDELVVSEEYDDDGDILRECMEYYVEQLKWTFRCDLGTGENWHEAKLAG